MYLRRHPKGIYPALNLLKINMSTPQFTSLSVKGPVDGATAADDKADLTKYLSASATLNLIKQLFRTATVATSVDTSLVSIVPDAWRCCTVMDLPSNNFTNQLNDLSDVVRNL